MLVSAGAAAVWGLLDKQALENCMGVIVMALATVMAGTGHLPTFKLLRGAQAPLPLKGLPRLSFLQGDALLSMEKVEESLHLKS